MWLFSSLYSFVDPMKMGTWTLGSWGKDRGYDPVDVIFHISQQIDHYSRIIIIIIIITPQCK
jgi:hypothetical protein